MGFETFKETYTGRIRPIVMGKGENAVSVGGETCYPFYRFEGEMPNKPKIAMEIWDIEPVDWPASVLGHFRDVVADPAAWAKKCAEKYGANLIALQLKSTDPNDRNASPADAAVTVKKVLQAVDVPIIVWGTANVQKDEEVFKKVAEECRDTGLIIGPVEDKNHKGIGASAMGFGHMVIASSPIDVNLAKQVNILLENLGVPTDRMIIDPTTGGLGYGLEYTYSVMERIRMAALTQSDDKLQLPIINNLGNEIWKCKEAKLSAEEAPALGDPEKRGILMEAVAAICYLLAGSDVLIMRHPEAIRLVKSFIDLALEGGMATGVAPIQKILPEVNTDYAALSPTPNLAFDEEKPKKAAPPAKKDKPPEPPKAAEVKRTVAVEKPEVAAAEPPPAKEKAPSESDEAAQAALKAKIESEVAARLEADVKATIEAKMKAEAEEKAKAEAEMKANAEAEAKLKADELAARFKADEEAIRKKRVEEREAFRAEKKAVLEKTIRVEERSNLEKILMNLNRIHRRAA